MRTNPSNKRLIPVTALRHLYLLLRDFPKEKFHLQCATEFDRKPKALDALIGRSFKHFSHYDNQQEAFHNRGVEGVPTKDRRKSTKLADQLAVALYDQKVVKLNQGLSFAYVDYDVSPFRTTGAAAFESGISSTKSGRGGVDVLLVNSNDGVPIVGEVKAEIDTTPLLALIQAMTYAVEFATPNQRQRLQLAYPNRFRFPTDGPSVDVYILLVRPPDNQEDRDFLALIDGLSRKLMQCDFVPTVIRRIVCVETPFDNGDPLSFQVRFQHSAT